MLSIRALTRSLAVALLLSCISIPALAEMTAQAKQELKGAAQDVQAAMQRGPQDIKLIDQAVLKLPQGYAFIPNPAATRFMAAIGNPAGQDLLGLVVPIDGIQKWLMVVTYEKSGYIKDDDAKHWNVDELLDSVKKSTEDNNKRRASMGIPELEVVGWVQKPDYVPATHELIWSVEGRNKGAGPDASPSANYNTYVLGREGYINMKLISDLASIQGYTVAAHTLLDDMTFNNGKRYVDFNASSDKVAEYGLAALIGGVALKKIGLFALAAAFFVKIWKLIALTVFGVVTGVRKYLKRKKTELSAPPPGNLK